MQMRKQNFHFPIVLSAAAMFVMIIDSKTSFSGAREGIELCMNVVIPSLYPFMVLSMIITSFTSNYQIRFLRRIANWLHLSPQGFQIYLISLLGGYPVGAQCICQAYQAGTIDKSEAERMLTFSNNAGPAFIFGIGLRILGRPWMCWAVWIIHILASTITAILTPGSQLYLSTKENPIPLSSSTSIIQKSVAVMATVCSWIILFRVILSFLQRWIMWILPRNWCILFAGILELANGSINLAELPSSADRLILFSFILGFGGICVLLQTKSVLSSSKLSFCNYFPGKLSHAAVSFLLSLPVASLLCENLVYSNYFIPTLGAMALCICYRISFIKNKKRIAFSYQSLYNGKKIWRYSR